MVTENLLSHYPIKSIRIDTESLSTVGQAFSGKNPFSRIDADAHYNVER
jgi:hypothetical protein